jgi:hypothetical protein
VTGRRALGIVAGLIVSVTWLGGTWAGPFAHGPGDRSHGDDGARVPSRGLLSVVVAFFAMTVTKSFPFELPGRSWYWDVTFPAAFTFVALGAWSFVSMFGGKPVLALPSEEPVPLPSAETEPVGQG